MRGKRRTRGLAPRPLALAAAVPLGASSRRKRSFGHGVFRRGWGGGVGPSPRAARLGARAISVGGSSPGRRRLPFAARPQRGGGGGGVRPAPCRGPPRRLGFLPRPAPPPNNASPCRGGRLAPRPCRARGRAPGMRAPVVARGTPRCPSAAARFPPGCGRAVPRAPEPAGFWCRSRGLGARLPATRRSWGVLAAHAREVAWRERGGGRGGPRRSGGDRRVFLLVAPSPAALLLLRLSSAPRRVRSPRPVGSLGLVVVVRLSLPRPAPPARPRARRLVLPRAAARLCSLLPPTPGASPPLERVGAGWGGVGWGSQAGGGWTGGRSSRVALVPCPLPTWRVPCSPRVGERASGRARGSRSGCPRPCPICPVPPARPLRPPPLRDATSDQTWRPAEFKHISQRRKRN